MDLALEEHRVYNYQPRTDGKRSPQEVLGWLTEVRFHPEDLERAFFSTRFLRKLDALGYATFRRWRLYGEEGLAGSETALWLQDKSLMLEHAGQPLSRYEIEYRPDTGKLLEVARPTLFETASAAPQPRLFALSILGETEWLKALKLNEYAPRCSGSPAALQQALFSYLEAM